jgi:hypothetical protein
VPRLLSCLLAPVAALLLAGCGGSSSTTAPPTTVPAVTATTPTTRSPIEGVQTFAVVAAHSTAPVSYPQIPPVGGTHNPVWTPCTFYDKPVQNEMAVHSLEHGAIWITYRADLPAADVAALATLARSRKDIVASPWDDTLPSPLVATAWGRQLVLQSTSDPRLTEFIRQYANQGPELNAPC